MKSFFVKPNGEKLGLIELWDLSSEEFFALMDEIQETICMFERWKK